MAKDGRETGRKRRKHSWFAKLILLLVILCGLAWCAPWIVARTSLRNHLTAWLVPQFEGRATLAGARFDWLSPIELRQVEVFDARGDLLLQAEQVDCNKRLVDLIRSGISGATISATRPHLFLRLRADGSNLEDAIRPLLDGQEQTGATPEFRVEVMDGKCDLRDEHDRVTGTLTDVQVALQLDSMAADALTLKASAKITDTTTENSGVWSSELTLAANETTGQLDSNHGRASLQTNEIPLPALEPLLHRFAPTYRLAGSVSTDLRAEWISNAGETRWDLAGDVEGAQFAMSEPRLLGPETFTLEGFQSILDLAWQGNQVEIRKFHVDSDLADLDIQGIFETHAVGEDFETLFGAEDFQVKGRLNLAQFAARLPRLLKIRNDTQITAGELAVDCTSSIDDGTRRWQASFVTRNLSATAAGRALNWERPISVDLKARKDPGSRLTGLVTCRSDFLELDAEGSLENATISARADLDTLAGDLRQLVDLGDLRLAGQLAAGLELHRDLEGRFDANGHALFQNFEFAAPGRQPVRERRLTLAMDAQGKFLADHLAEIQQASVKILSGGDHLNVKVREPITDFSASGTWPLAIDLGGQLSSWLPRIQPWISVKPWEMQGGVQLNANLTMDPSRMIVEEANLSLSKLVAGNQQITIREPSVIMATSFRWNRENGTIESQSSTVAASSVALRADQLSVALPDADRNRRLDLRGEVALRGDLAKLQTWLEPPGAKGKHRLEGRLDAVANFAGDGDSTRADWQAAIQNLVIFEPRDGGTRPPNLVGQATRVQPVARPTGWTRVWSEAKVTSAGRATYDRRNDRFVVESLDVKSKLVDLQEVTGAVDGVSQRSSLQATGRLTYDLSVLSRLMRPYVGDSVRIAGQGDSGFRVSGRLPTLSSKGDSRAAPWWSELQAESGLNWDRVEAYGLVAGAGKLQGRLANGVVGFDPLTVAFSQGQLQTTPEIRLTTLSPTLVLSPGSRIDRTRLTPELCQSWLQYVAPVLANATRAEGQFSMELERATIPLTSARQSNLAGLLEIHNAQIRPGPMTEQLVNLAQQIESIVRRRPLGSQGSNQLNIEPQQVAFAVADGQVQHRGFRLEVGDVQIQTSGIVDMDGRLQIVAEVPIRDAWVEGDRYLRGLRGQVVRIPISGTLSRPKLDKRALSQITRQMAGSAAGGLLDDALQDGLQKGLENLLKKKP